MMVLVCSGCLILHHVLPMDKDKYNNGCIHCPSNNTIKYNTNTTNTYTINTGLVGCCLRPVDQEHQGRAF